MFVNIVNTDKRVLVLFGSPHENGHTNALLREYVPDGYRLFSAYKESALPCDDCGYCKSADGCSKRDLDEFYAALEDADVLVFASPVYNLGFPAPMKAVLDRLQRYYHKRFTRKEILKSQKKPAYLLLTSGSGDNTDENRMFFEKQIGRICSTIHFELKETVWRENTDKK